MAPSYRATFRPIWLCSLLALASLGCVLSQTTNGTGISRDQVDAIVIGSSTRADVAEVFGAPDEIIYSNREHDALSERAYKYSRLRRKTTFFSFILFSGSRSDSNHDNVVVFFDDSGFVDDIAARLDMDRPKYGAPWGDDDR